MNTYIVWVYEDWEDFDCCFMNEFPLPLGLNLWRCPVDQTVRGVTEGAEGLIDQNLREGMGWV